MGRKDGIGAKHMKHVQTDVFHVFEGRWSVREATNIKNT